MTAQLEGTMTIGELARHAGVGVETVRFYERAGILAQPHRRPTGYRRYPASAVRRIRFVRRAKELGFALREINELLSLRAEPRSTCRDVQERAAAKITDIEARIRGLRRMRTALVGLTRACRGEGPISDCPILDALDQP